MAINDELAIIESEKLDSPHELQSVLEKLGISCHATHTCVYIDICPKCGGEKTLYIRDRKYGELYKYRCYKCEAHVRNYDSLVGLIRLFHPSISVFMALNKLIDVAYKPESGECKTILTFGKHAGKTIDKTPPHYLKFLVEKSTCLPDDIKEEIENYLLGIGGMDFPEDSHPYKPPFSQRDDSRDYKKFPIPF